jgi:hypothetical protein
MEIHKIKNQLLILLFFSMVLFISGCASCPESCDDGNPCTKNVCSSETNFECVTEDILPCCGNNIIEEGETCSSCPQDVKCPENEICSEGKCTKPILSASEIYRNTKESMFIVETECEFRFSYPSFDVNYKYDSYYDSLDIEIKKLGTKESFYDESIWSGSGFLLNDEIITNYHVIDCEAKEIEEYMRYIYWELVENHYLGYYFDATALEEIDYDIKGKTREIYNHFYNSNRYDFYFEEYIIEYLLVAKISEFLSENIEVYETNKNIYSYHESDGFTNQNQLTKRKSGDSFPERDFAILDTNTNEKSLTYDEDYKITIGEEVFVIGFPAIEVDSPLTEEEYYNWETKKEPPIITRGIVSSLKESNQGVKYYVIDAAAYHGSSGGPVINNKGEVIGILTAGIEGLNFILPLHEVNLK